ncbi:hypothetical protein JW887_06515 [Candidatus Dojkabacteria bacterium]|nr:hypothetical protein [Candidatus Dojkabacteria bacterium]
MTESKNLNAKISQSIRVTEIRLQPFQIARYEHLTEHPVLCPLLNQTAIFIEENWPSQAAASTQENAKTTAEKDMTSTYHPQISLRGGLCSAILDDTLYSILTEQQHIDLHKITDADFITTIPEVSMRQVFNLLHTTYRAIPDTQLRLHIPDENEFSIAPRIELCWQGKKVAELSFVRESVDRFDRLRRKLELPELPGTPLEKLLLYSATKIEAQSVIWKYNIENAVLEYRQMIGIHEQSDKTPTLENTESLFRPEYIIELLERVQTEQDLQDWMYLYHYYHRRQNRLAAKIAEWNTQYSPAEEIPFLTPLPIAALDRRLKDKIIEIYGDSPFFQEFYDEIVAKFCSLRVKAEKTELAYLIRAINSNAFRTIHYLFDSQTYSFPPSDYEILHSRYLAEVRAALHIEVQGENLNRALAEIADTIDILKDRVGPLSLGEFFFIISIFSGIDLRDIVEIRLFAGAINRMSSQFIGSVAEQLNGWYCTVPVDVDPYNQTIALGKSWISGIVESKLVQNYRSKHTPFHDIPWQNVDTVSKNDKHYYIKSFIINLAFKSAIIDCLEFVIKNDRLTPIY